MPRKKKYSTRCSVCLYLKKHDDVKFRVNHSSYFIPEALETVLDVFRSVRAPFTRDMIYYHLKTHQKKERLKALMQPVTPLSTTLKLVEGENGEGQHVLGLDEFIEQGRQKLRKEELQITSTTFLTALKIKHDADKSQKDRRMEALKALFAGGAASGNKPNTETDTPATT